MWVDVSVDGAERFAAHVASLDGSILLPTRRASRSARTIDIYWPKEAAPLRRLLADPEPIAAGWLRWRLEPIRADGSRRH